MNRLRDLLIEFESDSGPFGRCEKVAANVTEFETYIRNNSEFFPKFGERRRQGDDQHGPS